MTSVATKRPWGAFEVLHAQREDDNFVVKRIIVNPGQRLSLQSHVFRSEHWVVVRGRGEAILGKDTLAVGPLSHIFVPRGVVHRLCNTEEDQPLVVIEVQCGTHLDEGDIIRYEDDYARA